MKRGLLLLTLTLALNGTLSEAVEKSPEDIRAFCIDFNWGEGGPNGFARPGLWADADPAAHVAWYKGLGANVIQTFCVSCNGYAWYKGGVVPEQPGLKHDFLTNVVRLGHAEGMKVMGYFCVGANTRWGQAHPDQSYGTPAHTHIPFTTDYIDYLCGAVADVLTKTGCDGFMVDWFFNGPYNPHDAPLRWLPCEEQMWTELMDGVFPGKERITVEQETKFKRRAVERCWTRLRQAAKAANPDCILWLSCHDLKHPQLVGSKVFQEVDWLMNEAGDMASIDATRKMLGKHTKLIICVVGWGDRHNARELVPAARAAGVGVYGFSRPGADSLPLPIDTYHARAIDTFKGNDRNIATLARWYKDLPFAAVDNVVPKTGPGIPVPSQGQITWHEQERLMFVCLDPASWQGREYDNHSTKLSDMKLPQLDTDQWCAAARAWDAKMILFVAKHTGGFCWWQTDTSDYSVKNIAWKDGKGCLLDELAQSCGKYGLNMGIYVYPGDDTWGAGIGSGGKTRDPNKQEAYNRVFRQQLREATRIAKRHTNVVEFWFDGSCIIDVGDVMQAEAPDAVILQGPYATLRWVGTERGTMLSDQAWCTVNKADLATGVSTSFHSTAHGDAWAPCEINTTLYDHHWFWSKPNESKRKSLDELMRVYYESVGQGTVMLLNSTPNTQGLIPDDDMKLYRALGAEIKRRFDSPIAQTQGQGREHIIDFKKATTINHVTVMEDYTKGERIRRYIVEGWDGQVWKTITGGTHVGRKHINFFDDTVVSKLRLKITESIAEPLIKGFTAHYVTDFKQPAIAHHTPWHASPEKIAQIKQAMQSNWKHSGAWTEADFKNGVAKLRIDLTGKITEAGQWQLKFTPADAQMKLSFSDAVLLQQGQASVPGVLAQSKDDPMIWNISRTAVVTAGSEDMRLELTLSGTVSSGDIVVRKR
jgi:alpha-L-fucosidase